MNRRPSLGFEKLDRKVQQWIWDKGWTELRDIQEESISLLLSPESDAIIASGTASGKTEAAYLPICSYLVRNSGDGIRVIYISPLKALINDQYQRLEELCEYCDIPVHRWHGDVSAVKKKKILESPDGLLLITPESLEAIFVNHGTQIMKMFKNLSYVIIDELHVFIDNERGKQIQSILCRLELVIRNTVPRIGLSATIGDMSIAAEYIRSGSGDAVKIIESRKGDRELRVQIRGYKSIKPDLLNIQPSCEEQITEHMFKKLRGSDNLIFANSRSDVEVYADRLRQTSEKEKLPNEFFPHHGSLSKDIRQETEKRLKDKYLPTNVICTTTLEMGIDIGNVKTIAQLDCPFSVASMRQRLGRSGRKEGDPSILRIFIQEEEVTERTHPKDMLREQLFQSVSMTELLIKKWVEPPDGKIRHFSTLIQQLLSLIAQYGGVKAEHAWKVLCFYGPFKIVKKKEFIQMLRKLGGHEIITQMHEGTLVLGVNGERIVNHYTFYAAFVTYDEYRLISVPDGKTLGTIPITYPVFKGVYIIFAGRRWIITEVKEEQKVILLQHSSGGIPPKFSSSGGLVHDEIRREMFKLYVSDYIPLYLNNEAVKLLREGRDNFNRLQLSKFNFISSGKDTLLFPWIGDKVMNTLMVLLLSRGLSVYQHGFSLEILDTTPDKVTAVFKDILKNKSSTDVLKLASLVKNKVREKYDCYLPELLLCSEYSSRYLDHDGALNCIKSILKTLF